MLSDIREVLECVLPRLIDHPKSLTIDLTNSPRTVVASITPLKADIGKLVGRRGQTADGMRAVMKAICGRYGKTFHLEIVEV